MYNKYKKKMMNNCIISDDEDYTKNKNKKFVFTGQF